MSKVRVGIIFGGRSAEHEVSLQSARNIVDALDRSRFEPVLIGIDKAGHWHLNDTSNFLLNQENPALIALNQSNRELAVVPGKSSQQLVDTSGSGLLEHVDVIFPIVHGTLGEDGCLQGLLRMADLPLWVPTCSARRCAWTRTSASACCAMPGLPSRHSSPLPAAMRRVLRLRLR